MAEPDFVPEYMKQPDGERFVDAWAEKGTIPPFNTWDGLQLNQLIDIRNTLEDKAFAFRNNPAMVRPLQEKIQVISQMITQRLNA